MGKDRIRLGLKTRDFDLVCIWRELVMSRRFRQEERDCGLMNKGSVREELTVEEEYECWVTRWG